MTLNIAGILRESAKKWPSKTAIVLDDTRLSYAELHGLAQHFAGALRGLGVHPGQHVALMLPNVPQFTVAYYGCHYAATPVVPLNVLLTPDEVAYHLDDSDAVALAAWEGFFDQARAGFERADQCKHLILAKTDATDVTAPNTVHSFAALVRASKPVTDLPPTMPDDTAVLLYTSGTTGRPKGAELTHFNMFGNADYVSSNLLPMQDQHVTALTVLPLFHSFGQTCMQNAVLRGGGTIVLVPRFEPGLVMGLIQEHQVNFFAGVPTMYFGLLHFPEADQFDLSSLTYCLSGGAAMPVEVMKAFDAKYNVSILEGYGLSETSPVASFNVLDKPQKAGSIGIPIGGVEFRLEDSDGKVLTELGERGEICIKGPNIMKGYYKRPEVNAEQIKDGWFHSGDVGVVDEEGYYFIVDRKKDMIIRGGFNVYPREIEEVLYAHPAVAEAAVLGVPHERHGEEIKAVLALKPGHSLTSDELVAYCKEHLAAYKYPRVVEFMDALPKGPTGKILKRELRIG